LECLVTIHEIALGPETGDVDFTLGLDTINRVVEADEADRQLTRRVEQRRLDDVLGDMTPLMMKLDVEGYEEHVLRGATRTLHEPKLKVLEIETLSEWIEGSLEQHGFVRRFYDPFTRLLTAKPNTPF
jgi:FkbM family methyltransferase